MSPGRTEVVWLRGVDLNHRPLGYEPNELPHCSTPQLDHSNHAEQRQTSAAPPVSLFVFSNLQTAPCTIRRDPLAPALSLLLQIYCCRNIYIVPHLILI